MYEDNSKNVSIKGIVVKILLIILAICILIWIFPTKKDLEENLNNMGYNNGENVNIDPLLDQIFTNNITLMQSAGKAYYYSATLPKNTGDSSTITLQELINKKYLVEFRDRDGNSCDTSASYVQLTKKGTNKYEMKTYLKCNTQEDTIIDNLGCTDLCPNACTNTISKDTDKNTGSEGTKETYKYLYSCPTTEWSSWSSWSTTKVTASSTREVKTEKRTTEKCNVVIGTEPVYETKTETYKNTIPNGATGCDYGVLRKDSNGYYRLYTCKTQVQTGTKDVYGCKNVTTTWYKYRTATTKTSTVWSNSSNDTTLKNKGCTITKTELVTTK